MTEPDRTASQIQDLRIQDLRAHVSDTATWVVNTIGAALGWFVLFAGIGTMLTLGRGDGEWFLTGVGVGVLACMIRLLTAEAPARPAARGELPRPLSFEESEGLDKPDPR